MTTFDDRKDAFEARFAHDAELQFRVEARRNKLLGLWAAALMGRTGDDADAYAREVISSDFQEAGDGDVLRKLAADLAAAGRPEPEGALREALVAAQRLAFDETRHHD